MQQQILRKTFSTFTKVTQKVMTWDTLRKFSFDYEVNIPFLMRIVSLKLPYGLSAEPLHTQAAQGWHSCQFLCFKENFLL